MKNLIKVALLATGIFAAAQTQAQTRDTTLGQKIDKPATKVGKATAKTAKKVGNKTSELASKGAAAVANKRYEGHWGLTGVLVFIVEYGKYFYVDKK